MFVDDYDDQWRVKDLRASVEHVNPAGSSTAPRNRVAPCAKMLSVDTTLATVTVLVDNDDGDQRIVCRTLEESPQQPSEVEVWIILSNSLPRHQRKQLHHDSGGRLCTGIHGE